jgi:hypothetical protein
MEKFNLDDMERGWFIGNFNPTVFKTHSCEVAIKKYLKDDYEERHFHKIATEVTVILSGEVLLDNTLYKSGDIIKIQPGKAVDFKALTDVITIVVKLPGAPNDKYLTK